MKKIWKYPLDIVDQQLIEIPGGEKPISVQYQRGELVMWVEVDTSRPQITHSVYIVGTGHELPSEPVHYAGTVQANGGALVWHVYLSQEYPF